MNKKLLLDNIIESLGYKKDIPQELDDKKKIYEELVINNKNFNLKENVLLNDDKYLRLELIRKKLLDGEKIKTVDSSLGSSSSYASVLALWKGDITSIYCDAIVNSVSGDFSIPKKKSLDYDIRLRSGLRLRQKINDILDGNNLEECSSIITRAYNLPCDFIIHSYVPEYDENDEEKSFNNLKEAYLSIMECAKNNLAKVLVLPALGTGCGAYPKERAIEVAILAVKEYLGKYKDYFTKVIFDVDNDELYDIYKSYLEKED